MAEAVAATASVDDRPKGLRLLGTAFTSRKTAVMTLFGFGSGLPSAVLVGTIPAWLGEWGVSLTTIGIISMVFVFYAFKFLWSPLVDRLELPLLGRLGRRRGWILLCQLVLVAVMVLLAQIDPRTSIAAFALVTFIGAFASATQDIVIDAWRIDVADERATVEVLSSVYQIGSRAAALVGGALALYLSTVYEWPDVFMIMAACMAVTIGATLIAHDTPRPDAADDDSAYRAPGAIEPKWRAIGLVVVGLSWAWAVWTIGSFMVRSLTTPDGQTPPSAIDFTRYQGPLIIAATVIVPALVAALFNVWRAKGSHVIGTALPPRTGGARGADHAYHALITPLAELIRRLGWGVIIVLLLILSYRITDSLWGSFANPFYLKELQYTGDEVAFASKIFGVLMTMAGVALGAILFTLIGRMPTLLLGAILAAVTNLLYADLAIGAPGIDAFAATFGLDQFGDIRMTRLMIAISGENLAGGLAGAAYVGYLSSITSREFSAVQYALLSSLTLLVGALGRAPLGQAIDQIGYAPVFRFTAALGIIAVVVVILEWVRTSFEARRSLRGSPQLQTADDFREAQGEG